MKNILKIFDPVTKTWKGVTAIKGDTGKSAYQLATEGGYKGTEAQFKMEQATVANNSGRLSVVEQHKQDKPVAGRTFLTPLFVARGAVFNETTGFYELNELMDIVEGEMIEMYQRHDATNSTDWTEKLSGFKGRTNFGTLINNPGGGSGGVKMYLAFSLAKATVIALT